MHVLGHEQYIHIMQISQQYVVTTLIERQATIWLFCFSGRSCTHTHTHTHTRAHLSLSYSLGGVNPLSCCSHVVWTSPKGNGSDMLFEVGNKHKHNAAKRVHYKDTTQLIYIIRENSLKFLRGSTIFFPALVVGTTYFWGFMKLFLQLMAKLFGYSAKEPSEVPTFSQAVRLYTWNWSIYTQPCLFP